MRPEGVTTRAYAKINLGLRLLARQPDGFHELRTVFQSIDLHDTLMFSGRVGPFEIQPVAAGTNLISDRFDAPLDETNLIWRAAALLSQTLGRRDQVRDVVVTLDKRIPARAGLGGASSDAACALVSLLRLWHVDLPLDRLGAVARQLGADVPYFLSGGTALGLGRGDEIHPVPDLPQHWVVLLVPSFGVATADAYRWYDGEANAGDADAVEPQEIPGTGPFARVDMTNDLERAVGRRHPEITAMKSALRAEGAFAAAMAGSGSTVFGLFSERERAAAAVARLDRSECRAILSRFVGRAEYGRVILGK